MQLLTCDIFNLEGRGISLCELCTPLFVFKLSSKYCLSCLCLTSPCCCVVQLCGVLALGGPLASLGLLVLWCGGLLGGVQHVCLDWCLVQVVVGHHTLRS